MYNITMQYYKIITYGCQMNEHESEKLAGMLENDGYVSTENVEDASVIVFNTCCIRENAERKAYGNIGALKKLKLKNKDKIIAVCGCMPQQKNKAEELRKKFPFIDIIFGTHNLADFSKLLNQRLTSGKKIISISDDVYSMKDCSSIKRSTYPSAYVNVMYGCNNFCSYCIVPYVRGRERSRQVKDVVNEVASLVKEGYKEINLLGQNVDSYGKDLSPKADFSDLLAEIVKIEGKYRIRFMSNHPKDVNEKLCKTMLTSDKICKSIHLPVQSGSTKVLRLMNRKYTRHDYLDKVKTLRKIIPNITITTDIMVGFPKESHFDFLNTLSLVKKVKYSGAFTFVYSPRSGTKASTMSGQISEKIKKKRIVKLVNLQNEINAKLAKEYIGKTLEVLVDEFNTSQQIYIGRDDGNKVIHFNSDKNVVGEFIKVKITKADGISLFGEIV